MTNFNGFWATGIHLKHHPLQARPAWSGRVDFHDDGWFGNDNADTGTVSTRGILRTRTEVADGQSVAALTAVIDALIADAGRLNVEFARPEGRPPALMVDGPDVALPDDWYAQVRAQADRIGWVVYADEMNGADR